MRKFTFILSYFSSVLLLVLSVVASIALSVYKVSLWWYLIPLAALALGVKILYGLPGAYKTGKKEVNALADSNESCKKLESNVKPSRLDIQKEEFSSFADAIYMENAMKSLLKKGDEKLSKDEKKMWAEIQRDIPFDNPLKVALNKKFYTCDFEDLKNPIC